MASPAHEILLMALRERPELLASVLVGRRLPEALRPVDTSIRFADVSELRPDLVLASPGGAWVVVEVQRKIDERKAQSWPLIASALHHQRGSMGDMVVITHRPDVARWASRVGSSGGGLGTRLSLRPVVVLLSLAEAERLLDLGGPDAALLAAWAMHGRSGPRAVDVVERALSVTAREREPLRGVLARAILQMLSPRLLERLRREMLDPEKLPATRAFRRYERSLLKQGKAEGKVEGRAEGRADEARRALSMVLEARGLSLDARRRRLLDGCDVVERIERWLVAAATAASLDDVFGKPSAGRSRKVARPRPSR